MGSYKANNYLFAFPSMFYKQDDFETPLDNSVIDIRHPQSDPNTVQIQKTRLLRRECGGVFILDETVVTELGVKSFRFPATPELLTGWLGLAYGAMAAPTGTPADEIQTLQHSGTVDGGTVRFKADIEGVGGNDWTPPIALDGSGLAPFATVRDAIRNLRAIKNGATVSASGDFSAGMPITFGGKFAKADMPALIVDNTNVTGGGTITVTETQKGTNKKHVGTHSVSDILPYISFIEGVIGASFSPELWYGFAVNRLLIEAAKGGDLFLTVDLFGRADAIEQVGYIFPACSNELPINTKDCRVRMNGAFVSDGLSNFRFEKNNNIVTSEEAFAFDSPELETNERGEVPTETAFYAVQGSKEDTHYADAKAEIERELVFMLGTPKERVNIIIPQANLKLASPDISWDGALRKSVINVDVTPYYDATLQASSSFEANISRTDAFLTTAP